MELIIYFCGAVNLIVKNRSFMVKFQTYVFSISLLFLSACSDSDSHRKNRISDAEKKYYDGIGSGPVQELKLPATIDSEMAMKGGKLFEAKCLSCHQLSEEKRIGPGLIGITKRRRPEWIMNQMLDPMGMTKTDSLSKELLKIYLTQMTPMGLSEVDARNILEYFRKLDGM
jgi:hypothetical protein